VLIVLLGAIASLIAAFFSNPPARFSVDEKERYRKYFIGAAFLACAFTIFGAYKAARDRKDDADKAAISLRNADKRAEAAEERAKETLDRLEGLSISLGVDQMDAAQSLCPAPSQTLHGRIDRQEYKVWRYPMIELWFRIPGGSYAFSQDSKNRLRPADAVRLMPCLRQLISVPKRPIVRQDPNPADESTQVRPQANDPTSGTFWVWMSLLAIGALWALSRKRRA
jgi:hypothetical protein